MRLKQLEIRKLYGSIDKEVKFQPDLNLLVGINGSGKTSVLNVADWLLRSDMPHLCTTPFERVALHFEHGGVELLLEAVQSATELNLYIHGTGVDLKPFKVTLRNDPSSIVREQQADELAGLYRNLAPEPHERPIWEVMKGIPQPTVIALDRTISADVDGTFFEENPIPYRSTQARSPLAQVLKLTGTSFSQYRRRVEQLNDTLKTRMVLSALRDPEDYERERLNVSFNVHDIQVLQTKVVDYVSKSIRGKGVSDQIRRYFERIRGIAAQVNSEESPEARKLLLSNLASRFQQMEDLASAFNDFETSSAEAYSKLSLYIDAVNKFLGDSNKQISINERSNQLGFKFLSGAGQAHGPFKHIRHLSSGERQILILLTFMAFTETRGGVFIVDEPELSLHPKWQSEFLSAFLSLKPKDTQLLLATHSPDIVGEHRDACVVLLP